MLELKLETGPKRPRAFLFRWQRRGEDFVFILAAMPAKQGSAAVRASLRTQEDSHSRGALQTGEWAHQGERTSPGDDRAAHAAVQGVGVGCGHLGGGETEAKAPGLLEVEV